MLEPQQASEPGIARSMSEQQPTWKTREGRVLLLTEMSAAHLTSVARMLENRYLRIVRNPTSAMLLTLECVRRPSPDRMGELAYEAASEEYCRMLDEGPPIEDVFPVYRSISEELFRRGNGLGDRGATGELRAR